MRYGWILFAAVAAVAIFPAQDHGAEPETRARADAVYSEVSRAESKPATFAGDVCIDDCSGHRAGYEWAAQRDIDDPDDCDGNSQSFIEGCRAYADGRDPDEE